jgi:hypothetical protein
MLQTQGFLVLEGEFEVERVLLEEFRRYDPLTWLLASSVHALVMHVTEIVLSHTRSLDRPLMPSPTTISAPPVVRTTGSTRDSKKTRQSQ